MSDLAPKRNLQVNTEHVLLGLIAEESLSKNGYLNSGLTAERAKASIEAIFGRRRALTSSDNVPFSREVRKMLENATHVSGRSCAWAGSGVCGGWSRHALCVSVCVERWLAQVRKGAVGAGRRATCMTWRPHTLGARRTHPPNVRPFRSASARASTGSRRSTC